MILLFIFVALANASDHFFGTGDNATCLICINDALKKNMVQVDHQQESMKCKHEIICDECYKENPRRLNDMMGKSSNSNNIKCCIKDRQPGVLQFPESLESDEELTVEYGLQKSLIREKNELNEILGHKDEVTQHLLINCVDLTAAMTIWIALEHNGKLIRTWDRSGYVLQQLVRTYFGFVVVAGIVYTLMDPEFKWKDYASARRLWNIKPSYVLLYLFTITSNALMIYSHSLSVAGEGGEAILQNWTSITSWFTMLVGLFIGIYSVFLQKKFHFQDKRFAHFQMTQPAGRCCMAPTETQTFGGNVRGSIATIIPFFDFFAAIMVLIRNSTSPEMFGKFFHYKFIFGWQVATWSGLFGLLFGFILVLCTQIWRHEARVGTFTLNNLLLFGISFFSAIHSDPLVGLYFLFVQFVIAAIIICVVIRR